MMFSPEQIQIFKVTLIGAILLFGVVYRIKTFGSPKFYQAIAANAGVFSAFALGMIYLQVTHTSLSNNSLNININGVIFILSAPLAYLGLCLWRKKSLSPLQNKVIIITMAWFFAWDFTFRNGLGYYTSLASLFFVFFFLGVLNAVLGPILFSISAVQIVSSLLTGQHDYQAIQKFLIENGFPMVPGPFGVIAGLAVTALGIGEFSQYFGVSPLLNKINDAIQE